MIKVIPPNEHTDVLDDDDYLIVVKRNKNATPEVVCSVDSFRRGRLVAQRLTNTVLDGYKENGLRYICVAKDTVWFDQSQAS